MAFYPMRVYRRNREGMLLSKQYPLSLFNIQFSIFNFKSKPCYYATFLHLFFFPRQQADSLHMARLLHLDVEWMARFAIVRGRSRKFIKACFSLKTHRFLPLPVLGNRSKTLLLLIICKRTDLPIVSRLLSEGTSLKSHRLNSA